MIQLLIFDSLTLLTIIIVCVLLYSKLKSLYDLSLHKGIKYLSNAMLFYIITFVAMYAKVILDYFHGGEYMSVESTLPGLLLVFVNLYFAALGGFYLAYSLMWKRHEKDRIKRFHLGRVLFLNLIILTVVLADVYLIAIYSVSTPFLFFGLTITILIWAINANCMHGSCKRTLNPFIALLSMGLGIYVLLLIENLLIPYFFTIHYYVWVLVTTITLTFLYYVNRVLE